MARRAAALTSFELEEVRVVDEALGDQDDALAPLDRREPLHDALDHVEGDAVLGDRLVVDVGGGGEEHPVLGPADAPSARERVDAVRVVAALDPLDGLLVAVDVNSHRLLIAESAGRDVGDVTALEAVEHLDQLVASGHHPGGPPGPAPGGYEAHAVPFAHANLQKFGHGAFGAPRLKRRHVNVIEDHDQAAARVGDGVRVVGHDRPRRRIVHRVLG